MPHCSTQENPFPYTPCLSFRSSHLLFPVFIQIQTVSQVPFTSGASLRRLRGAALCRTFVQGKAACRNVTQLFWNMGHSQRTSLGTNACWHP